MATIDPLRHTGDPGDHADDREHDKAGDHLRPHSRPVHPGSLTTAFRNTRRESSPLDSDITDTGRRESVAEWGSSTTGTEMWALATGDSGNIDR